MATAEDKRQVIWTREIDESENTDRWRKLGLYYGVPVAVALVLALVLGGFGAFLGVLILTGVFGLLVGMLVFFKNFGAKQNATIVKMGDELVLGTNRVDLTRVESWATVATKEDWAVRDQAIYGNAMAGDAITARVVFRLAMFDDTGARGVRADGGPAFERVVWGWPMMPPDHLDRLRDTIAPHVPAPVVDLDEIGA